MPDADPTLTGTTALVTGASRGFGRAIALALAGSGATVVGVARDGGALDDVGQHIGQAFTPVTADVTSDGLAARLLAEHRPGIVVLNAGATPHAAHVQDHTWDSFSANWQVDVRHAFDFTRAALLAPLAPGSTVISLSSGAARMGSPMSGGYAGAKATIGFISAYARGESERAGLGIRFVAILPRLTPATGLGTTFVDSYAEFSGVDRATYLEQFGPTLSPGQVGTAVVDLATRAGAIADGYLLTTDGLATIP